MINFRPQGSRISVALSVIAVLVVVVAIFVIFYALRPIDTISITQIVPTSDTTINRNVCITNQDCVSGLCIGGVCQDIGGISDVSNSQNIQNGCDILSDVLI